MKFIVFLLLVLNTLSAVDKEKFSGRWYEIARTPNKYQKECTKSYVEYDFVNKNKVKNICQTKDNETNKYKGHASLVDKDYLKLRYYLIFTVKYKITYLNDYKTAVVADDKYLWILSREKNINETELEKILNIIKDHKNFSKLIFSDYAPIKYTKKKNK
ncbi:MAG: Outer membrane lipoprotein Blc [uncultured Campylobacterales bacterium]|uniref:Outer membrane lipoprotein Blc n=1 Tax=uncultured Campylobacterales bacterium TaxID=352960 RepID=A0A6S6SX22_9BACT|nr:MAG: Outer membrane lipoprotein Blc [uncultured Campylobacterales bacterium]